MLSRAAVSLEPCLKGTIRITAKPSDRMLVITVEDDGRGLALDKLREKGLRFGLIPSESSFDQVAALIFVPGISTAGSISEISGRGIGMDAVRRFLEEAGGSIAVELKDFQKAESGYAPFAFRICIPIPLITWRRAA